MFARFRKKPATFIGFDINSDQIISVELKRGNGGYCLESYAVHADIAEHENKMVTIALPYSAAITKIIQLDMNLNEEEIEDYLTMNMKKYTGLNAEDISMDFSVLGPAKNSSNKIDVELIAAKQEQVKGKIAFLQQYNIKVKAVDIESFALQRAALLQLPQDDAVTAVINVKQNNLLVGILQNKDMLYVREENVTPGQDINEQINAELQMFFAAHSISVDRILMAGEVTGENILIDNIPVSIANPFINMEIAPQIDRAKLNKVAHFLLISCGLALWQADYA